MNFTSANYIFLELSSDYYPKVQKLISTHYLEDTRI